MHIRKANRTDTEALASLASRTFIDTYDDLTDNELAAYVSEFFSRRQIDAYLDDRAICILVAESDQLHGYALLEESLAPVSLSSSRQVQCVRLFVDAQAQGQSLGSQLLHHALSHARCDGFDILWVKVWDQNTRAISFYEQRGFEHIGSAAYTEGGLDDKVLIMARDVGETYED